MGTATTAAPPPGPLTGFTIGVTATRRREELVALLRRRGARVVEAPTLRIVPLDDDAALRRATERCLAAPLDYVVATTGLGWRGWMSAADGWGLAAGLAAACRGAAVLTRGPKATGAVRASGLAETYSPGSEATGELLRWLLARELAGRRVAVQEHGAPLDGFAAALRDRGAEVIEVPVYRWGPPEDPEAVRRLVELTVRREVHALTFTSAPAIDALLRCADSAGRRAQVLAALGGDVLAACVGPLCARPLLDLGIHAVVPERGRLGALVRTLAERLPARGRVELVSGALRVVLQGDAVVVDDGAVTLPPMLAALLRALAEQPGRVLSRAELLRRVWGSGQADEHAVEAAVARLRGALGAHAGLVRTVPKRGYRLAVG
ncbi:uroporphyrinogen-III synthase [Streptantibioticus cattleyicolor]|uniref:Bifunctional uroporphyrinogen-III synthetase/response regulator domain protein n=1 Tax=Streptantibioticus cattleyicolor (strain ATCC 35852 / DSM 46488 / JCM 4925 / NBRC 14057 / NRRL 8057) TaxID=1003195 RepID=F8JNG7_STREN|nr:uroporphyrinogen-III synthase [Streptantibioticus cattleyicolor]AEW99065.1 bifunctional uroporphyrinogen-III synthetase/response regulator domain protein [Streptantibioticus cattleyicolor NRRL 8057 = DSM 46488]CCB71887.1 Uroporphyrinogen-III synthase [Streptantibioticus cattleyicolor NRRL 8057 = DSM 46488]